jgi:hypothetical protein
LIKRNKEKEKYLEEIEFELKSEINKKNKISKEINEKKIISKKENQQKMDEYHDLLEK